MAVADGHFEQPSYRSPDNSVRRVARITARYLDFHRTSVIAQFPQHFRELAIWLRMVSGRLKAKPFQSQTSFVRERFRHDQGVRKSIDDEISLRRPASAIVPQYLDRRPAQNKLSAIVHPHVTPDEGSFHYHARRLQTL